MFCYFYTVFQKIMYSSFINKKHRNILFSQSKQPNTIVFFLVITYFITSVLVG